MQNNAFECEVNESFLRKTNKPQIVLLTAERDPGLTTAEGPGRPDSVLMTDELGEKAQLVLVTIPVLVGGHQVISEVSRLEERPSAHRCVC